MSRFAILVLIGSLAPITFGKVFDLPPQDSFTYPKPTDTCSCSCTCSGRSTTTTTSTTYEKLRTPKVRTLRQLSSRPTTSQSALSPTETATILPPSLNFRPLPPKRSIGRAFIWYRASDVKTTSYWIDESDKLLKPYVEPRSSEGPFISCEQGVPPEPGSKAVCDVKINEWFPCTHSHGYNFNSSKGGPCIFLKFDQIHGWVPEYYNYSTVPDRMPIYLKQHIKTIEAQYGPDSNKLKVVWVSCEGENVADIENIGSINYRPTFGFDGAYFPFTNADEYLSPLVAVYFEKPTRGVIINVECKAWARNIVHDRLENGGSVRFDLFIDD